MESSCQDTTNETPRGTDNCEISDGKSDILEEQSDDKDVKNNGLSEMRDCQKQDDEQDVSMATENMEVDRWSDELSTEGKEESGTCGDIKNGDGNTETVNGDDNSGIVLNPADDTYAER